MGLPSFVSGVWEALRKGGAPGAFGPPAPQQHAGLGISKLGAQWWPYQQLAGAWVSHLAGPLPQHCKVSTLWGLLT